MKHSHVLAVTGVAAFGLGVVAAASDHREFLVGFVSGLCVAVGVLLYVYVFLTPHEENEQP